MSYQQLLKRLESLEVEVVALRQKSAADDATIARLNKKVDSLEKQLSKANEKLGKNSSNSSIAPSQDPFRSRKNKSLRKKSGKKTGGQPGHKGITKKMTDTPDIVEDHFAEQCQYCQSKEFTNHDLSGRRQVIDIPPIEVLVTEHRIFKSTCSCCGKISKGDFPIDVKSPVSYGSQIDHLISYLSVRQYMSFNRIKEFFAQFLNIHMSEGSIQNKLKKVTAECVEVYNQLREQIEDQSWLGSDETSMIVNGEKHWLWVWQNHLITYLKSSASRGFASVEDTFPQGLPNAVMVSDRLAAQLKQITADKQVCLAHLLRTLKGHLDANRTIWFEEFRDLLYEALQLSNQAETLSQMEYEQQRSSLEYKKQKLLNQELQHDSFQYKMQKKISQDSKDYLFTFLYNPEIPPDNNSSERAIRNAKVKQKVSGMFKTEEGMQCFAILRSIIDTGIKKGFNALQVIQNPQLLTT